MKNNGLTKNDSLAIKGIAIILMIFHHLFCEVSRFKPFDVSFAPFNQQTIVDISLMMKICVSIFAFISGYGLLKSIEKAPLNKKSVSKWSAVRLIKTMSGFWFIYVIAFIVTFAINRLPLNIYFKDSKVSGIVYILLDFLGLSGMLKTPTFLATWWYMGAAIVFILLIPIIYMVSRKVSYIPVIAVIVALPRLLNVGYPGGTNPYTFLLIVVFGMIFAEYKLFERISDKLEKCKIPIKILLFLLFLIIAAFFALVSIRLDTKALWEIKYSVIPLFFICFFRYCIVRIPILNKLLEFLGKHSMTIYLTHNFIRYTYLGKFIYSFGNFMIIFLVLFALSLALALVIDFIKSITKYDKLIGKLTAKITE